VKSARPAPHVQAVTPPVRAEPQVAGAGAPRPDSGGSAPARNRNFGPDAPPKNKRKPPRKDERGPRGPIKERPVSRLYENDEDWRNETKDDLEIDDVATSARHDDDTGDDE
jgi:hypothetical protein